jgi:hypothetical protein
VGKQKPNIAAQMDNSRISVPGFLHDCTAKWHS